MKRVVIVGGTGNISVSIACLLIEKGYDVTCFNRGQNKMEMLPADVRYLTGDRKDRTAFEKTMQAEKFDYAIDMVCFDAEDAESDVRAFMGVEQFLMCSTACTYGVRYDFLPVAETHPLRPWTSYGINKAAADQVFLRAYREKGFPVTIIKPSTTYGNQVGMVSCVGINNLWIDRARKGKPLILSGNGVTPHQFLHVADAAKGFVGALGKTHCIGESYNLVREGFTDWKTYYETGLRVLGCEAEFVNAPLDLLESLGYMDKGPGCEIFAYPTIYSCEKIYRDIPEFRPVISLEDGMREVIAYSDEHGMIPDCAAYPMDDCLVEYLKAGRRLFVK